ncbi:hypothetical protein DFS34DRAFT_596678 [Phlyctochytrium arcticum]|nr:hypothetical protein DFS34DRAFT_596678 [Phlyctochytrium arcticum]
MSSRGVRRDQRYSSGSYGGGPTDDGTEHSYQSRSHDQGDDEGDNESYLERYSEHSPAPSISTASRASSSWAGRRRESPHRGRSSFASSAGHPLEGQEDEHESAEDEPENSLSMYRKVLLRSRQTSPLPSPHPEAQPYQHHLEIPSGDSRSRSRSPSPGAYSARGGRAGSLPPSGGRTASSGGSRSYSPSRTPITTNTTDGRVSPLPPIPGSGILDPSYSHESRRYRTQSESSASFPPRLLQRSESFDQYSDQYTVDDQAAADAGNSTRTRTPLNEALNSPPYELHQTPSSERMDEVFNALEEQAGAIHSLQKTLQDIQGQSEADWESSNGDRDLDLDQTITPRRLLEKKGGHPDQHGTKAAPRSESLQRKTLKSPGPRVEVLPPMRSTQQDGKDLGMSKVTAFSEKVKPPIPSSNAPSSFDHSSMEEVIMERVRRLVKQEMAQAMPAARGTVVNQAFPLTSSFQDEFSRFRSQMHREVSDLVARSVQGTPHKGNDVMWQQLEGIQQQLSALTARMDGKVDSLSVSDFQGVMESKFSTLKKEISSKLTNKHLAQALKGVVRDVDMTTTLNQVKRSETTRLDDVEATIFELKTRLDDETRTLNLEKAIRDVNLKISELNKLSQRNEIALRENGAKAVDEGRINEMDAVLRNLTAKFADGGKVRDLEITMKDLLNKFADDSRIRSLEATLNELAGKLPDGKRVRDLEALLKEVHNSRQADSVILADVEKAMKTIDIKLLDGARIKELEAEFRQKFAILADDTRIKKAETEIKSLNARFNEEVKTRDIKNVVRDITAKLEEVAEGSKSLEVDLKRKFTEQHNRVTGVETSCKKVNAEVGRLSRVMQEATGSDGVLLDKTTLPIHYERQSNLIAMNRLEGLETRMVSTEQAVATTRDHVFQTVDDLSSLRTVTDDHARTLKKHHEHQAEIVEEMRSTRVEIDVHYKELQKSYERIGEMETRAHAVDKTLGSLDNRTSRISKEIKYIQSNVDDAGRGILDVNSRLTANDTRLDVLENTKSGLHDQLTHLVDDFTALQPIVDEAYAGMKRALEKTNNIEGHIAEINEFRGNVKNQVLQMTTGITSIQTSSEENIRELRRTKDRVSIVETRLGSVENVPQLVQDISMIRGSGDENTRAIRRIVDRLASIDAVHRGIGDMKGINIKALRDKVDDLSSWRQVATEKVHVLEGAQKDFTRVMRERDTAVARAATDEASWKKAVLDRLSGSDGAQKEIVKSLAVLNKNYSGVVLQDGKWTLNTSQRLNVLEKSQADLVAARKQWDTTAVRKVTESMERLSSELKSKMESLEKVQRDLATNITQVDGRTAYRLNEEHGNWTKGTLDRITSLEQINRNLETTISTLNRGHKAVKDKLDAVNRDLESIREERWREPLDTYPAYKQQSPAPESPPTAAVPVFEEQLSSIAIDECASIGAAKDGRQQNFNKSAPTKNRSSPKPDYSAELNELRKHLEQKVDTSVLEELLRHVPTRDELKEGIETLQQQVNQSEKDIVSTVRKMKPQVNRSGSSSNLDNTEPIPEKLNSEIRALVTELITDQEAALTHDLELKVIRIQRELLEAAPLERKANKTDAQQIRKDVESKVRKDLKAWFEKRVNYIREETVERIKKTTAELREEVQTLAPRKASMDSNYYEPAYQSGGASPAMAPGGPDVSAIDEIERVSKRLTREFDEKLFMICSDLSICKAQSSKQLAQPFHRCGQWLWKSGCLKLGSAIPWNVETCNTDAENMLWEKDHTNIRVSEPGLYEITFAFFTKAKPSIQLVVNGESVLSAINSPSYVVHHSSGYVMDGEGRVEQGTVTGISLLDFLALPPKSTLSIHYHGGKKGMLGHGFLGLRKL